MKTFIKYITISSIAFLLLSFTGMLKNPTKLRYTILPIENSKEVFSQCSRHTPKFRKIITVDDSIYENAIDCLIENKEKIENTTEIKIEEYTYQIVSYTYNRNTYIYINASITDLTMEKKHLWKEHPIIWCDGNSSYWGATYDIKNNKLIKLKTNGPKVKSIENI
jgi:hypothetical protein